MGNQKKLLAVVGPTAAGKTELAIWLAQRAGAEIVSADSRQIYREMNVGTAKPSAEELAAVQHHFIGCRSIHAPCSAAQYGEAALRVIEDLFTRHDYIVLCGGSGLYMRAVCEGLDPIPLTPPEEASSVWQQYVQHGLEWLQREVAQRDPDFFSKTDQQNPRRLLRALTLHTAFGLPMAAWQTGARRSHAFDIVKIGLAPSREELYERINLRVDKMMAHGMLEETRLLLPHKVLHTLQTVGYRELFGYMEGAYSLERALELFKRNTRRYAKRQLTWFRQDEETRWFTPDQRESIAAYAGLS